MNEDFLKTIEKRAESNQYEEVINITIESEIDKLDLIVNMLNADMFSRDKIEFLETVEINGNQRRRQRTVSPKNLTMHELELILSEGKEFYRFFNNEKFNRIRENYKNDKKETLNKVFSKAGYNYKKIASNLSKTAKIKNLREAAILLCLVPIFPAMFVGIAYLPVLLGMTVIFSSMMLTIPVILLLNKFIPDAIVDFQRHQDKFENLYKSLKTANKDKEFANSKIKDTLTNMASSENDEVIEDHEKDNILLLSNIFKDLGNADVSEVQEVAVVKNQKSKKM